MSGVSIVPPGNYSLLSKFPAAVEKLSWNVLISTGRSVSSNWSMDVIGGCVKLWLFDWWTLPAAGSVGENVSIKFNMKQIQHICDHFRVGRIFILPISPPTCGYEHSPKGPDIIPYNMTWTNASLLKYDHFNFRQPLLRDGGKD